MLICCRSFNQYERTIREKKEGCPEERKETKKLQPMSPGLLARLPKPSNVTIFAVMVQVYQHSMVFLMEIKLS